MLLTPREAAGRLGVHPDTLRGWRRLPQPAGPPYTRTEGGHARYEEADIDAYLQSRKVNA